MRKDDYKKHLDKISCSDEFRRKMEELLSAEQEEIYAESVTTVERAGKINYHRWAGIAASAVLLAGIGGVAVHTIKNAPDSIGSSLGDTIESSVVGSETIGISEMNLMIDSGQRTYSEKWGIIPKEASDLIIEKLKISQWEPVEDDKNFNSVSDDEYIISIDCIGEDSFTYSIGANGYSYVSYNGEESYFNNGTETYYDIVEIIAGNIPFCDWNQLLSSHGAEVDAVFKEHKEEIKRITSLVDSFDIWIPLFNNGLYSVEMDSYGKIKVYYRNQSDGDYWIYFESSAEMAEKLYNILVGDKDMTINGKLETLLDNPDFIENGNIWYYTGQGQFSKGFEIGKAGEVGGDELIKLLADYEWVPAEDSDYIKSDYIMISYYRSEFDLTGIGINVNDKGELYDHFSGTLYRAENQNLTPLQEKFDGLLRANDDVRVAYNLCSRADNFTTLESEVSIYYNPLDKTGENKPVNCTGMLYLKNQTYGETKDVNSYYYMTLNGVDSDYIGEFYKKGRYWAFVEKNGSIAKGYYSGLGDFEGYNLFPRDDYMASGGYDNYNDINIDYDWLCNDAFQTVTRKDDEYMNVLDYNHAVGQANDIVKIEYIEQYDNTEIKNDYSEILEFKVNGMGALIYLSRSRKNLETGEVEMYLEFKLCDGVCLGFEEPMPHYDPNDFAIPVTSEELMKEFELVNET